MGRDDDRTWAELVETFHASPDAARPEDKRTWPEAEDVPAIRDDAEDLYEPTFTEWTEPAASAEAEGSGSEETVGDGGRTDENLEVHDHFEPQTPPAIPRGDAISRAAWAGVLGSPALLVLLSLLQWSPPNWLTILLIGGFVGGFGVLVARLRGHHPDDPDNGAVV